MHPMNGGKVTDYQAQNNEGTTVKNRINTEQLCWSKRYYLAR